eukprot:m.20713 g.20713  ORF g.20713 m.20713 type:complete len:394 (+) comp3821_c0_seq1:35-1216(+)
MSAGVPLSLMLVCSGKILLNDLLGVAHPDAGFCAGSSGFDCVCAHNQGGASSPGSTGSSGLGAFDQWYTELDGVIETADNAVKQKVREPFVVDGKLIDTACEDKNANCSWWAEIGECQRNPGFLIYECPSSCNICRHSMPRAIKCQRDPAEKPILESPGGLTRLMESIVANQQLKAKYNTTVILNDPWILQFDNFGTREQWEWLENELRDQFEGSTVVGELDENGHVKRQTLQTRTSSNAWCNLDSCYKSPVHRQLQHQLMEILGPTVKEHHMEALQVLKYKPGTFYHPHHDTITDQIKMWSGPRMFTAFIYFNDKPEGGGETEFTHIHPTIKVKPKLGRMILWPSQMDSDSTIPDDRTTHQACNVTSGHKEAANLWVHLYDYQTPSFIGCAG